MPIQISWQGATLGANTFTGAQVAPSLALGGAALGSNALAVSGTSAFGGNINPTVGGSIDLGTAAVRFGAIFAQSVGLGGYAPASGGFAGTSLALGGATIGTNALAVTGTAAVTGSGSFSGGLSVGTTGVTATGDVGVTGKIYAIGATQLLLQGGDGIALFRNSAGTGFSRLMFGGTDATYPAIARSGTTLKFRTADDLNDAPITASSGTFSGAVTVPGVTTAALTSTGTFTSGAGAQVGTLTNAPAAGNPTTWIKIIDNGVTRYIPAW